MVINPERVAVAALSLCAILIAGGCGDARPASTHNVKIDVGGSVVYAEDAQEGLAGVLVTLLDVDGEIETTTTNSAGLWTIENVHPGVYVETYELAGYETSTGTFAVPADLAQIASDVDALTFVELRMSDVGALTPLHGTVESFDAVLRFNATP